MLSRGSSANSTDQRNCDDAGNLHGEEGETVALAIRSKYIFDSGRNDEQRAACDYFATQIWTETCQYRAAIMLI